MRTRFKVGFVTRAVMAYLRSCLNVNWDKLCWLMLVVIVMGEMVENLWWSMVFVMEVVKIACMWLAVVYSLLKMSLRTSEIYTLTTLFMWTQDILYLCILYLEFVILSSSLMIRKFKFTCISLAFFILHIICWRVSHLHNVLVDIFQNRLHSSPIYLIPSRDKSSFLPNLPSHVSLFHTHAFITSNPFYQFSHICAS